MNYFFAALLAAGSLFLSGKIFIIHIAPWIIKKLSPLVSFYITPAQLFFVFIISVAALIIGGAVLFFIFFVVYYLELER